MPDRVTLPPRRRTRGPDHALGHVALPCDPLLGILRVASFLVDIHGRVPRLVAEAAAHGLRDRRSLLLLLGGELHLLEVLHDVGLVLGQAEVGKGLVVVSLGLGSLLLVVGVLGPVSEPMCRQEVGHV